MFRLDRKLPLIESRSPGSNESRKAKSWSVTPPLNSYIDWCGSHMIFVTMPPARSQLTISMSSGLQSWASSTMISRNRAARAAESFPERSRLARCFLTRVRTSPNPSSPRATKRSRVRRAAASYLAVKSGSAVTSNPDFFAFSGMNWPVEVSKHERGSALSFVLGSDCPFFDVRNDLRRAGVSRNSKRSDKELPEKSVEGPHVVRKRRRRQQRFSLEPTLEF